MIRIAAATLALVVAGSTVCRATDPPPAFEPTSVPEHLRVLEGRVAYIKIPSQDEAPLLATQGAVLRGNAPAQLVTGNTGFAPVELALREHEFDRFMQGDISEADLVAFMDKQFSTGTSFLMLEEGAAVRIIAPRVDDGFATQVSPLTGHLSEAKLGGEIHVLVSSCFLRFTSAADQELFNRGKTCRYNRQAPFVYDSLGGDDVSLVPAAEDAHAAALEKVKQVEQEQARLAAAGAQEDAQAKAEADARVAEQARVAAEKAKQATQGAAAASVVVTAPTANAAPVPQKPVDVASLNAGPSQADLTKSVQTELRRVGCLAAPADGDWNAASQRSLSLFNKNAGTRLDVKTVSADTLDAIKQKTSRVCPLVCEHGYKVDGDQCAKIVCAEGAFLNDDNKCEKRREKKPVATRDRPEAKLASEARQAIGRRSEKSRPGMSSPGRPLTGLERAQGCYSNQAIMSGECP